MRGFLSVKFHQDKGSTFLDGQNKSKTKFTLKMRKNAKIKNISQNQELVDSIW